MNINTLNKAEARAACKKAGIKYGDMTVAEMRAALEAHAQAPVAAAAAEPPATVITTAPAADPSAAPVTAPAAGEKPAKAARQPREQQNSVKKPGEGTICRRVWDWMDENRTATALDVRTWATAEGLNANNAQIERGQWRKFHGLNKPAA
jgi:hypothetical protein